MTSPRRPYWPAEPPRRWMQEIFLAPELSATSRIVPIWIMVSNPLLGPLHDLTDPPALGLRQRTAGDDLHHVADVAPVLLVVGVELLGPLGRPVVEPVGERVRHLHDHRLVHLVAHHPAHLGLPAAPLRGSRRGVLRRASRFSHIRHVSLAPTCPAARAGW